MLCRLIQPWTFPITAVGGTFAVWRPVIGGNGLWLRNSIISRARSERARLRFDLAVVSVLLDAGAGDRWRYIEPSQRPGLQQDLKVWPWQASIFFTSWRVLGRSVRSCFALTPMPSSVSMSVDVGTAIFRWLTTIHWSGTVGRARLMNALGHALQASPALFGAESPRVGHLVDYLVIEQSTDDGRFARQAPSWPHCCSGFSALYGPSRLELDECQSR